VGKRKSSLHQVSGKAGKARESGKSSPASPEKTFSGAWEKLKSGPKPPRQTPGCSGHGTTEFGLKLLREILFLGLSGVERLEDEY